MNIKTTSPAYNRQPITDAISGANRLCELPWQGKIILRGDSGNPQIIQKAGVALSVNLPTIANTVATSHNPNTTIFWMSPNEWLIHCDLTEVQNTMQRLSDHLSGHHHAVVEVSDYYTVLHLQDAHASALLAKACPLDLHNDHFPPNTCAQTKFGHASVLLHKLTATPSDTATDTATDTAYHIQVRWSYTEYVWDYLSSAMKTI